MTYEQLRAKLRSIGGQLEELTLTQGQKSTGAQMEINQAIIRIAYAVMALNKE